MAAIESIGLHLSLKLHIRHLILFTSSKLRVVGILIVLKTGGGLNPFGGLGLLLVISFGLLLGDSFGPTLGLGDRPLVGVFSRFTLFISYFDFAALCCGLLNDLGSALLSDLGFLRGGLFIICFGIRVLGSTLLAAVVGGPLLGLWGFALDK